MKKRLIVPAILLLPGLILASCSQSGAGGGEGPKDIGGAMYAVIIQKLNSLNGPAVRFVANGGSPEPAQQKVAIGGMVTEPGPMTKTDHSFSGWYLEPAFISPWDFAAHTVTGNMTLYAKWEAVQTSARNIRIWLTGQSGGLNAGEPVSLPVSIDLGNMTQAGSGWRQLLDAINSANKYVELDLSLCTMSGTEFNPDDTVPAGKDKIVKPILPGTAESIAGWSDSASTLKHFSNLESVEGRRIVEIGEGAFYDCTSLTSASFPIVTSISDYAFRSCTSLISVSFPEVTSIGEYAFRSCTSLISVSFPVATSIGEYAFYNCTSLTTIEIPSVTSIGSSAFARTGATSLTITTGPTAPTVGANIFNDVWPPKNVTVRAPGGALGNYGAAWQNAFKGAGSDGYGTPGYINLFVTSR